MHQHASCSIAQDGTETADELIEYSVAEPDDASRTRLIGDYLASPDYWLTEGSPADVLARRVAELAPHLWASPYEDIRAFEIFYHPNKRGEGRASVSLEFDLDPPDDIYAFYTYQWRLTACCRGISSVFVLPYSQSKPDDLGRVVAALQAVGVLPEGPKVAMGDR